MSDNTRRTPITILAKALSISPDQVKTIFNTKTRDVKSLRKLASIIEPLSLRKTREVQCIATLMTGEDYSLENKETVLIVIGNMFLSRDTLVIPLQRDCLNKIYEISLEFLLYGEKEELLLDIQTKDLLQRIISLAENTDILGIAEWRRDAQCYLEGIEISPVFPYFAQFLGLKQRLNMLYEEYNDWFHQIVYFDWCKNNNVEVSSFIWPQAGPKEKLKSIKQTRFAICYLKAILSLIAGKEEVAKSYQDQAVNKLNDMESILEKNKILKKMIELGLYDPETDQAIYT